MKQEMYNYKIYNEVYDEINRGSKTVEFRLLNEKSAKVINGDLIKFSVVDNENKSIIVRVTDKIIYDNLEQLWEDKNVVNDNTLNYSRDKFIDTFYNIFGKDKVINSKIVGIKFKLV